MKIDKRCKPRSKKIRKKISEALKGKPSPMKGKKLPHLLGKNACHWKGGRWKNNRGYILIYCPEHPFAILGGYIFEHRLVMEKFLGRYLKPKERVHHINRIKTDNRLKNLKLFPNDSKHKKDHYPKGSLFGIHNKTKS